MLAFQGILFIFLILTSRPKEALSWGIPVPGDEEHIMYVWCDALANYISGPGYGIVRIDCQNLIVSKEKLEPEFNRIWPADIQVIGKDILRFHAAFWPAMLLSAKLPLPR